MPRQYPQQFRERALRMVEESLPEQKCEFAAMKKVATKLEVSSEAIRRWKRHSEVDSGLRPGISSEMSEEIKRLERENLEIRRANEILKSASAFFASRVSMRPSEGKDQFH
jgi:transposase